MDKISVEEFFKRTVSFREKMGRTDLNEDQRQNLKKMFVLSWFDVDMDDPDFNTVAIQSIFTSTLNEYTKRMLHLGMEP